MGSDTLIATSLKLVFMFQFTLPHGERPFPGYTQFTGAEFQFTLPHGERHAPRRACGADGGVSIHAPAWGATRGLAA